MISIQSHSCSTFINLTKGSCACFSLSSSSFACCFSYCIYYSVAWQKWWKYRNPLITHFWSPSAVEAATWATAAPAVAAALVARVAVLLLLHWLPWQRSAPTCCRQWKSSFTSFSRSLSRSLSLSCPNLPASNWQLHTGRPLEQLPSFRCCTNRSNTAAAKMLVTEAEREEGEEGVYYY